jgi:hypothetical protein
MQTGPYLRPTSDIVNAKVYKIDCCGSVGPSELIALEGPKGVQYIMVMRRVGSGIDGRLAIYAPHNIRIKLTSRQVQIEMEQDETTRRLSMEVIQGELYHHEVKPWGVPPCINIGMNSPLKHPGPVPGQFIGTGKHGSELLMDVRIPQAPTGKFVVRAPGILIDDIPFIPPAVEFRYTDGDWEIYPMNC